jgi:hypothetical protein
MCPLGQYASVLGGRVLMLAVGDKGATLRGPSERQAAAVAVLSTWPRLVASSPR